MADRDTASTQRSEHLEDLLDAALEASFPASDPPAMTQRDDLEDGPKVRRGPRR